MDKERFIVIFIEALKAIREPQFFEDERGYQGELLAELRNRIEGAGLLSDPIIQQEYQKTLPKHDIRIRPDIIIHIPFSRGFTRNRKEGNFIAVELKRRASKRKAEDAFESLRRIKDALNYPLTIFLNIDSANPRAELCPDSIAAQTLCVAVQLEDGEPAIRMQKP